MFTNNVYFLFDFQRANIVSIEASTPHLKLPPSRLQVASHHNHSNLHSSSIPQIYIIYTPPKYNITSTPSTPISKPVNSLMTWNVVCRRCRTWTTCCSHINIQFFVSFTFSSVVISARCVCVCVWCIRKGVRPSWSRATANCVVCLATTNTIIMMENDARRHL